MRLWHKQLLSDTIKALVPFSGILRNLKRHVFPYSTDPSKDPFLLEQGLQQLEMLKQSGVTIEGSDVLEFGSGWNPIIPLLFYLAGARSVILTDQERLLDKALFGKAVDYIIEHREKVAIRLGLTVPQLQNRLAMLRSDVRGRPNLNAILDLLRFKYLVPFDPRKMNDHSVDIIISRAVLEHVPPEMLKVFLASSGASCTQVV